MFAPVLLPERNLRRATLAAAQVGNVSPCRWEPGAGQHAQYPGDDCMQLQGLVKFLKEVYMVTED